jgi:hypothetical protein
VSYGFGFLPYFKFLTFLCFIIPMALSAEEKKLVQQLRKELIATGVPREELAFYIQKELEFRRREAKHVKSPTPPGFIRQIIDRIKPAARRIFGKIMQKTMFRGQNFDNPEYSDQNPSFEEFLPVDVTDPVLGRQDAGQTKKRTIVDLDFDDE